jgi:hypothetical protein
MTASFAQPALIFRGFATSRSIRVVESSPSRRNVTLSMLDDDHQLIESLPRMWADVEAFLD